MLQGQKVVVVMPAYNAGDTLLRTWQEVTAQEIVDLVIVVDDASRDHTLAVARTLTEGHRALAHQPIAATARIRRRVIDSRSNTVPTSS